MKHAHLPRRRRCLPILGGAVLLAFAAVSQAASGGASDDREQRQACRDGDTYQSRELCLREAHAARAARRQGRLEVYGNHAANALARCEVHRTQDDVQACRARVMGRGEVSGSVAGGGLLRQYEYLVREPSTSAAGPDAAAPAQATGAPGSRGGAPRPLEPLTPAFPMYSR